MANLNTNTSVIDAAKSAGIGSDYASRAAYAAKNGITNYTGSAQQNQQLIGIINGAKTTPTNTPTSNTPPANIPSNLPIANNQNTNYSMGTVKVNGTNVNDVINSGQQQDFNNASSVNDPAIRTSVQNYNDLFKTISSSLTSNLPTKPSQVNLTDTYKNLRDTQGITDLETSLNDLQKQARDIQAANKARTDAELNKPVAMNVISGRVTEEQRQDNERLQAVNNSIQTVTDQLKTKYNVIDSIMKYTSQDYSNAVDSYDKQFSQNISVMNLVKGIADTQQSQADKQADNARADLQIIYNNLNSGGVDPSTIEPAQAANITKLELQAGLPSGFYANVVNKNPKADILSTTTRENGNKKYADVIIRKADGSLSTQSIYVGPTSTGNGNGKNSVDVKSATKAMAADLNSMTGPDGYVSPEDYTTAKRKWVGDASLDGSTFDKNFKTYANPESYYKLGL